jgi:hypothetical protein
MCSHFPSTAVLAATAAAAEYDLLSVDNEDDNCGDGDDPYGRGARPYVIEFLSDDKRALRVYCAMLRQHIIDLHARLYLHAEAFSLSYKRSMLFRRAYNFSRRGDFDDAVLALGTVSSDAAPRASFPSTTRADSGQRWEKCLSRRFL